MKLKCEARRYLLLFSCNSRSHITNYLNFKLSTDVEKNPGLTQTKLILVKQILSLLWKVTAQQCSWFLL